MTASLTAAVAGPAGYLALAALVAGESSGVPLPGETALLVAAVLAHQGHLSIGFVIATAAIAAMVGDNAGYLLGRLGARRLFERPGRWQARRQAVLRAGDRLFARHGPKAVFFGRFVAGARVVVAWLAGTNHMPWRRFLMWNAAGALAWAASVGLAGFLAGAVAERLVRTLGLGALIVAAAVAAVGLLAFGCRGRRPPMARALARKDEPPSAPRAAR